MLSDAADVVRLRGDCIQCQPGQLEHSLARGTVRGHSVRPESMFAADNVGNIQRTEKSGEASPHHHRLQHIPTPLRSHSDLPPGILPDSDHPPVCRQPHRSEWRDTNFILERKDKMHFIDIKPLLSTNLT